MNRKSAAHSQLQVRDFEVLLTVAECGSFRKASEQLSVGQPAVSRRIQKLEEVLGVSLFERHPSGARLTKAGWRFLAGARSIFKEFHAAIRTAQSAGVVGNGHLRVGLIASLSHGTLRDVVAAFVEQHPKVDPLCFAESDRSELLTLLSHRALDVVMAAGELASENADILLLAREPLYLAVQSSGSFANKRRLSWDDVQDATFLVSTHEPGPEIQDYIVRRVSDLGWQARIHRHRLGREGIMNLVGLGLGVTLIPDHWCGVRYPNVMFVPIGAEDERVPFSLAWRPENDNPALRRFLSLSRAAAKGMLPRAVPSQSRDPSQ